MSNIHPELRTLLGECAINRNQKPDRTLIPQKGKEVIVGAAGMATAITAVVSPRLAHADHGYHLNTNTISMPTFEQESVSVRWGVDALRALGGEMSNNEKYLADLYSLLLPKLMVVETLRESVVAAFPENPKLGEIAGLQIGINPITNKTDLFYQTYSADNAPQLQVAILGPESGKIMNRADFVVALQYTGPTENGLYKGAYLVGSDSRATSKGFIVGSQGSRTDVVQMLPGSEGLYIKKVGGFYTLVRESPDGTQFLTKGKSGLWKIETLPPVNTPLPKLEPQVLLPKEESTEGWSFSTEQLRHALDTAKRFQYPYGFIPTGNEYGLLGYLSGVPLDFPKQIDLPGYPDLPKGVYWQLPMAISMPNGDPAWVKVILSTSSNLAWSDQGSEPSLDSSGGRQEMTSEFVKRLRERLGDRSFTRQQLVLSLYSGRYINMDGIDPKDTDPIVVNLLRGKALAQAVNFSDLAAKLQTGQITNGAAVGAANLWIMIR